MPESPETSTHIPSGLELMPMNPEYQLDPFALLDTLREAERVHHDTQLGRYIVSRFDDAYAVVNDRDLYVDPRKATERTFSTMLRQREGGQEPQGEPSMLFLDPPEHERLRGLVSKAFTPRSIEKMRPRVQQIANELLDKVEGQPSFDLMAAYCAPLPAMVIAVMLGVDPEDQADFKRWSDTIVASGFDPFASEETRKKAEIASQEFGAYIQRAIAERRESPRDDLITGLVQAEEKGDFLNNGEVEAMVSLLLAAGNVTTTDLMGNGIRNLLLNPAEHQKLKDDPSLVINAVEEMLRYEGPVTFTGRITDKPREIAGCPIGKGESITVSIGGANRDPRLHKDPEKFDITREDIDHIAFGGGRRYCLGAPLARMEAQIGILTLVQRFPNLRLAKQEWNWKKVPIFRGLASLIVEV